MANERLNRTENVFITYDGCVKNYRPELLKIIRTKFAKSYEGYVNIDALKSLSESELNGLVIQSTSGNIIEYIATSQFDFEKALGELYWSQEDIYFKSELWDMGVSMILYADQSYVGNIFFYTPVYDPRIEADIKHTYKKYLNKVRYVHGDISEVLSNQINVKLTSFALNDVMLVPDLIKLNKVDDTQIMIANYIYNYTVNDKNIPVLKIDVNALGEKHYFKPMMYSPLKTDRYQLVRNYK